MPKLKNIILVSFTFAVFGLVRGQKSEPKDFIISGNKEYRQQDFDKAEAQYRTALSEDENSIKANYNLGNALFKQKKFNQARAHYDRIIQNGSATAEDRAKAYHNIGKSYLDEKNPEKAVKNFKEALRLNPNDDETRYNYALAKKLMEEQQKNDRKNDQDSSQNKNSDKQKSDSQNQKDRNQKQQPDQNSQNRENREQQDEHQKESSGSPEEQNKPGQQFENGDNEEDARQQKTMDEIRRERMLEALGQQEQQTLKKIMSQKTKGKRRKTEKDW